MPSRFQHQSQIYEQFEKSFDDVNCGKQQMDVYPDGAERADTWANEYLIHYADMKANDRLKALLEICCK